MRKIKPKLDNMKKKEAIIAKEVAVIVTLSDGTTRQAIVTRETSWAILNLIEQMEGCLKVLENVLEGVTITKP